MNRPGNFRSRFWNVGVGFWAENGSTERIGGGSRGEQHLFRSGKIFFGLGNEGHEVMERAFTVGHIHHGVLEVDGWMI